jgi:hypothetical protein
MLCASPAFGQSPIQHQPRTTAETATSDGPLPGALDPSHPSTPNPAGSLNVVRPDPVPEPQIRAAAPDRDLLSNHLRLGVAVAYGTFSGWFLDRSPIGANLAGSPFVTFDLGYGLSRQLELVLAGDYSSAFSGSGCRSCSSTSWAVGPMLRYHLVEGARFDPWLALGVAFRRNSWDFGASRSLDSLEFTRLIIGGDWYATSLLAVGPVLGLGLNTAVSESSSGEQRDLFALYYAGLRLTLDLPGR